MNPKLKIILPIAGLVFIVLAVALIKIVVLPQRNGELSGGSKETPLPVATGNVDDVVAALLQDSSNEKAAIQAEKDDMELITSDSQEIGDFVKVYNENEF